MKVDIFDFDLDRSLIAEKPVSPRDHSKLLDLSVDNKISDRHFYDLPDLLNEGDVLVFNNTKVIPARLYGARGEAQVEVTLYHPKNSITWHAFIKNSKRLHAGDIISFYNAEIKPGDSKFKAEVIEKNGEEGVVIKFLCPVEDLNNMLEKYGSMPLPPYIKRDKPQIGSSFASNGNISVEQSPAEHKGIHEETNTKIHDELSHRTTSWDIYDDKHNYQTIYAKNEGAVAAPTAGLHFTPEVLEALNKKNIKQVYLTLHVGAGTFLPVKVEDTKDHKMHSEYGIITKETADIINQAKIEGKNIVSVGTTSLRLLESAADEQGVLHPFIGETNIFITPGYKFKTIDYMVTNFHLPKSTLFMLVSAVAGLERMKDAYSHAIKNKYRFYSYGDSSILKCVNKI